MKLWIRLARKKAGLTQEQLAEKLGLTKANISAWENGRHEASLAKLAAISEITGLPLEVGAPRPAPVPGGIEPWQIEDAERLRTVFAERKGRMSQEEFGLRFDIGSQSMIWQYLNARRPLNIKAAANFARGLGVSVDVISPRLANEIRRASAAIQEPFILAPTLTEATTPSARLQLVMVEQELDIPALAKRLGVETAAVRAWLEDGAPKLALHHAVAIQEAFGYSPAWLCTGKGVPKLTNRLESELDEPAYFSDPMPLPPSVFKRIPIKGTAQLGDNGHFCEIEYPVGDGDGFLRFPTSDPDAYGLRCVGDSMRPRVKHGEYVVIEPNHKVIAGDEVMVFAQDGRVMIKEYAYVRDGFVHLSSVNEKHGMLRIEQLQIERMQYVAGILKASARRPD